MRIRANDSQEVRVDSEDKTAKMTTMVMAMRASAEAKMKRDDKCFEDEAKSCLTMPCPLFGMESMVQKVGIAIMMEDLA